MSELGRAWSEVRSALDWAQVTALASDGISEREIARRLGINRCTVKRLVEADDRRATDARRRGR